MRNLALDAMDDRLHSEMGGDAEARRTAYGMVSEGPLSAADMEMRPGPSQARHRARIPRIVIQAFCDSLEAAAVIESAAADRLMARARVTVHAGGVGAAVAFYREAPTPNLIVVESRSSNETLLADLDRLSDVCDPGTKVLAIGHSNDIAFYRELMRRGISEYVLAPVTATSVIEAISSIYGEISSSKLGQIHAFIGAKGGVGSSTIAHNLAWTVARHFASDVVVADLDLPFGTASLDFNLDTTQGVAEAIQDAGRLDEVLLDRLLTKCGEHLSLLAAPALLNHVYDLGEGAIEPLLEVAQASVPFLILDMPHLWTSWARKTLVAADEVVITAVPDLANLRNAKSLVDFLRQARPNDPPPKLVLNQVGMPKRPEIKPREFANALRIEPIACLPFDAHLFGTAANKGQMIAESSSKTVVPKAFAGMAEVITGRKEIKNNRKGLLAVGALFGRMKRRPNAPAGKKL